MCVYRDVHRLEGELESESAQLKTIVVGAFLPSGHHHGRGHFQIVRSSQQALPRHRLHTPRRVVTEYVSQHVVKHSETYISQTCRLNASQKDTKRHGVKSKEWDKDREAKLEAVKRNAEQVHHTLSHLSMQPESVLISQ